MMSIRDTTILKGVAILFMLYVHLFGRLWNVDLCTTYLSLNDMPLVYLFCRCSSPVAFFLILSGYGLYISYSKRNRNILKRILKLYIHYWISMIIFVGIGFWVVGYSIYPGSCLKILENITGWYTSYNGEIWFLFPYVLLAVTSSCIFHTMDKIRIILFFLITGTIYFISYLTIHLFGAIYLYSHQFAYMPILYLSLLFPFVLGAILAKYDIVGKIKLGGMQSLLLLLLLIISRMCIETGIFHVIYAAIFIVLFVHIKRAEWLDCFLYEMGRRSTSMWFVHSYFCYYLFHDFIYGFKYPLVIFLVLLLCSYISAIIIDYLNNNIQKVFKIKS